MGSDSKRILQSPNQFNQGNINQIISRLHLDTLTMLAY